MTEPRTRRPKTGSAFPYSVPKLNDGCDPGMTLYQWAAVILKVPESGDEKLDAMIRRSHKFKE